MAQLQALILNMFEQGFLFAFLGLGVLITFRFFRFPDLTAEGSYPLGGAVAAALLVQGLDPLSALTALCEETFQVFIDEPGIIVMLNTENLYRGRHIAKSPIIRQLYARLTSSLDAILRRGSDAGIFRPDIDAIDLYISISGLGYFYLSNRFTLSILFDRDLKSIENLQRRKRHLVEMTLRFVCREPTRLEKTI